MKWNKTLVILALCSESALGGAPGTRLAPQQSQIVRDLQAIRKGNKVVLTWSQPRTFTNAQSSLGHAVTRICRNTSGPVSTALSSATACAQSVAEVDPQGTAGAVATVVRKNRSEIIVRFTDTLSQEPDAPDPLQFAVYTVEVRDDKGRRLGLSNSVSVPLAPTSSARGLHSQLDARGVYLIWEDEIESRPSSLQFDYRVYRGERGSSQRLAIPYWRALVHTRDGDRWTGVDTNIEWEKTYLYWVTPVTRVYSQSGQLLGEIEGDDSAPIEVVTHDVFPPAVPERLLAMVSELPGKKFVDLLWAPNIEKDLAGYYIYRRQADGQIARLNSAPITMLSFQDTDVAAGAKYSYSISAVDTRGNESAKSSEVAVGLP